MNYSRKNTISQQKNDGQSYSLGITQSSGLVNQVVDAGIPVINTQGYVGDGANILTFVGCDDYDNGWGQGQVLHELLEKDGKTDSAKIILIQALLGTTYTTDRTAGLEAYIAENMPGVEIIAYEPCDNDNAKTVTAMQNLLTRFPAGEVDAVVVQGPHDLSLIHI